MLHFPASVIGLALCFFPGVLVLTAGGLAVAWFRRSVVMAVLSGVPILGIGSGLLAMMSDLEDPTLAGWIGWWRADCALWFFVLLAGMANLIALVQLRRL